MIEVWAPRARQVEVLIGDERRRCRAAEDGRWVAETPPPGTDYAISVDAGPPRPDPRSRLQPAGVHGPSRWIDPAFPWTDRGFAAPSLATGLVYELHVGTFTPEGTFDGAIARLPDLAALGVTHVEVMPVAAFPGTRGWGYDGVGLYATHVAYGGPDGLRRFVDAAHAHGLAVVLDVVYNHLGPDGNYLGEHAPFFTDRYQTPWGAAVNLDGPDAAGVRRFFFDNARWWLRDCHLDGLRLDATHAIFDASPRHFLDELSGVVRGIEAETGRRLVLVAEHETHDPGLDGWWFDAFHHAIHAALTGERGGYYAPFGSIGAIATALSSHGEARALGHDWVVCIQNHDQIGNRALGERLGHLVTPGQLRVAAALLFFSPYVPLIFQGEEWGASTPFQYFTDHESEELAAAVRDGRRAEHAALVGGAEHVPDPQDPATFTRSRLDWGEREREPHRSILAWYRELIALRARLRGRPEVLEVDEAARRLVIRRGDLTLLADLAAGACSIWDASCKTVLHHEGG